MPALSSTLVLTTALVAVFTPVLADPNDWVNINYVINQAQVPSTTRAKTNDAQLAIVRGATTSAKNGPWSVTNAKGILPPSRDPHDYLSWAPYHWPNCNWCNNGSGRTHLVHNSNSTEDLPPPESDSFWDEEYDDQDSSTAAAQQFVAPRRMDKVYRASDPTSLTSSPIVTETSNKFSQSAASLDDLLPQLPQLPIGGPPPVPTAPPGEIPGQSASDQPATSETHTGGPAQAAAKTKKKTTTKTQKAACTPSPTKTLPPSATWTTCTYVSRDGQVNPDVRKLNGPAAINYLSQAVLYNSVAFALQKSATYSQNVGRFVDAFFLDPSTRMNPNIQFGQVVRGPGAKGQSGTFTGILDLRGIVKVVNGILVLKAAGSKDWTMARDQGMGSWMASYARWLNTSDIGKNAATRANNHLTFYVSQVAASMILAGNMDGAKTVLQNFFTGAYMDQVAQNGDQPFEAVRTRPYHYRCFNLEGLIVNAKLGDQLGLNLWTSKSKYGATIQTALDYIVSIDPKSEGITEAVPHVASIAAAYGDPSGKYAAFMKKAQPNYQSKPFWFYDQTAALPSSPAARMNKRWTGLWARNAAVINGTVPFVCPAVFDHAERVEIDDGIFVTCDELKPLYELPVPIVDNLPEA